MKAINKSLHNPSVGASMMEQSMRTLLLAANFAVHASPEPDVSGAAPLRIPRRQKVSPEDHPITGWLNVAVLGHGSCSTVYLALTRPCHRRVAVKYSEYTSSDDSLIKEERILADLAGCPEVVQCLGRRGSSLLLEYADGGTLGDHIRERGGRLAEQEICRYTRMTLEGLREIHERGYVHCDLKPDNILGFKESSSGALRFKIADFGKAKVPARDDGDAMGCVWFRGTPNYMSPESVGKAGQVLPALDIWSLGCVVVEMHTGQPAVRFQGHDFQVGSFQIKPVIPRTLSNSGRDFLTKCFEIDPHKRWTAEMLLSHPYVDP